MAKKERSGLERALRHFPGATPAGKGSYSARCLAHEDTNPSLSITLLPDMEKVGYVRLVIKCHRGCSWRDIVEAHGIDTKALSFKPTKEDADAVAPAGERARGRDKPMHSPDYGWDEVRRESAFLKQWARDAWRYLTQERRLSPEVIQRRWLGYRGGDSRWAGVTIPYFLDGEPTYKKTRHTEEGSTGKMNRYPSGLGSHLYNVDSLKPGGTAMVFEGEIDALSGETANVGGGNVACVSVPDGAESADSPAVVDALSRQAAVYIFTDNDSAGEKAARALAAKLPPSVKRYRVVLAGFKDANEALQAVGPERLRALVEEQMAAEVPVGSTTPSAPSEPGEPNPDPATGEPEDAELTDLGNAARFVRAAAGDFRYVVQQKRWHSWDGTRWAIDAGRRYEVAARAARDIHREAADAGSRGEQDRIAKHASQSQRRERLEAMVALAGSAYPHLKTDPDAFDVDPFALNVKNGTIDLRTGRLRPHTKADLITRLAPVVYDENARAPSWERFLTEIMPDKLLRTYLQRLLGYSIAGVVNEEILPFFHGGGRNGKGVVLTLVQAALGTEYATTAPPGLLMAKKFDAHPTELAALAGRRLVIENETDKNKAWNESRVKLLTGGDNISARGMHENFTEFKPTFKIIVASNYRPRTVGTDDGIWSRIKLLPFEQTFREADDDDPAKRDLPVQDKGLKTRLLAEIPGILRWLVEGCLAWQHEGLAEPDRVRAAVKEYRKQEDTLAPFLAEYPVTNRIQLSEYGHRYRAWAEQNGAYEMDNRKLGAELRDRGYEVREGAKGKTFVFPKDGADTRAAANEKATQEETRPVTSRRKF